MFRFKQPSSGSLPFVLCLSYNSQLKYIVKDGSAVWLHILSSPVCIVHCAECVTFCTVHDTHTKQGRDRMCSHTAEPSLTMYLTDHYNFSKAQIASSLMMVV